MASCEWWVQLSIQHDLRHANVLHLVGYCDSPPCLITELMEKGSLEDHLGRKGGKGPLTWRKRFAIFDDVCRGLHALHSRCDSLLVVCLCR